MKILLTTQNKNKIKEIKNALKDTQVSFVTLQELSDDEEILETGKTFKDNAYLKAKHFGDKHQLLSLADDSGLEVYALNLRPGVHSHRYGKTSEEANNKLIKELKDKKREARFKTVLCLYDPLKKSATYFEGTLEGVIIDEPRGIEGFGYDPIFLLPNNKTLAEISISEKSIISHRGIALTHFKKIL